MVTFPTLVLCLETFEAYNISASISGPGFFRDKTSCQLFYRKYADPGLAQGCQKCLDKVDHLCTARCVEHTCSGSQWLSSCTSHACLCAGTKMQAFAQSLIKRLVYQDLKQAGYKIQ